MSSREEPSALEKNLKLLTVLFADQTGRDCGV